MTRTVFSTQSRSRIGIPMSTKQRIERDRVVDQHRELEVERLFAVRVDLGAVTAFQHPDDERAEDVAEKMEEESEQSTGVAQDAPGAGIGGTDRCGWWIVSIPLFFHTFDVRAKLA